MNRRKSFCLVSLLVGLLAPACISSAQAQPTRRSPNTTPPNLSHLPEKAPPGWDQHIWDQTRTACNAIVQKSRANQAMTADEYTQAQSCMSLGYEFRNDIGLADQSDKAPNTKAPLPGNSPPPPGQVEADCTGDQCPGTQPGSCAKFNFPNDNMPACVCFPYGAAGAYKALNGKGVYQGLLFFDNSPAERWVGYRHSSTNPSNTSFDDHFPVYAQTSDGQCSTTPLVGTHIFNITQFTYDPPARGGINDGSFGACTSRNMVNGCYPCFDGNGITATKTIMGKNTPHNFVNELNLMDNVWGFYPATGHPVGPSNIGGLVLEGGVTVFQCQ